MSKNPINTQFKYDAGEDKMILKNTQDIEPLLKLKNLIMTLCMVE